MLIDAFSGEFLPTNFNYFKVLATNSFLPTILGFSNYFATILAFLVKFSRKNEKNWEDFRKCSRKKKEKNEDFPKI